HRQRLLRRLLGSADRAPVAPRPPARGAQVTRTLVLDPIGGIAGDMLIAALLHLGAPRAALDRLALPGASLDIAEVAVAGIRALHLDVRAAETGHAHRSWRQVRELIAGAGLPPRAAELAQAAFALLARAEGKIHGIAPDEIEFHEVGAIDSIVDVAGSALLIDALGPARILALPPPAGDGRVAARPDAEILRPGRAHHAHRRCHPRCLDRGDGGLPGAGDRAGGLWRGQQAMGRRAQPASRGPRQGTGDGEGRNGVGAGS